MPSGPESFVADPRYSTEFTHARELLLGHPGRWRIIYHYDGDGIASASAAIRALQRLGFDYQATPLQGVERRGMQEILLGTHGPVLVVDTGATWLDLYGPHPHPVIILDHHKYPGAPVPPELPKHVAFVNPLDWGVDGMTEMCAATLTWLFTIFLDPRNWDNATWGLSGAIADRQHQNGFKGLNARLVDEAILRSLVQRRRRLALFGSSVREAIARSIDPYFVGLSGRPHEVTRLLDNLSIDPSRPLHALDTAEERRLTQALLAKLVQQKVRPEFVELLTQDGYFLPGTGVDAQELSNLQNASGRIGAPGNGIALALGDPHAMELARTSEETWRTGILEGMKRVEEKGVNSLRSIQWFESGENTLAGTQAGLSMNYLLDPRRPVFAFSASGASLKLSGRGTLWLVGQGLDLATVCRSAADHVGGEGGGHRVAAGATIPIDRRDQFLAEADRLVGAQLPIPTETPR
ncbi:MAG: DHH family phosphoesterase [Thermoplasmata archaeon]|nr:DHH family phosphoesterase [Thermoplasmata archaeon]